MKKIKKLLFLVFCMSIILLGQYVIQAHAQNDTNTPTPKKTTTSTTRKTSQPTDTPTESEDMKRIEKIKDLVASRVAELKLVDKEGILGMVKDSNNTQISINDDTGNLTTIDIDELTQFSDSANKTFGISDVKKGDELAFVGLYNKQTKHLLARTITKMHTLPSFFEGIITDKDTKNFTYTAVDENGKERILNIETSTKIYSFSSSDDAAVKAGFSKAAIGERVFAAGFDDLKDPKTLNVSRLTYFTDLAPSGAMKSHANITETPSTSPSPTK